MQMHTKYTRLAALLTITMMGTAATAQSASASGTDMSSRSSWLPYTNNGYIGLDVGRSSFQNSCGAAGFACDRSDRAARIYLGGTFNPHFSAEIAYADYGDMRRAGGSSRAQGLNLSLVGRAPLTQNIGLYGKLGTTYGHTRVSAAPGSGVAAGSESGWGPAYGLGISWQWSPNWSSALEWNRQRFDFSGNNSEWVRATYIGLRYHY